MLNNGYLASASYYIDRPNSYYHGDSRILIWNPYKGELISILSDHRDFVSYLELLNNGLLVSGSKDTTIKVWNTTSGQIIRTLIGHKSDIYWSVDLLRDGQTLVSGSQDQTIKLWNWKTGECLNTINTGLNIYSLVTIKSKIVSTFKLFFFYSHRHRPVI